MSNSICPYCDLDTAGRHEAFCPGAVQSYTLAAQPLNVSPYPLVHGDNWIWCDERLPKTHQPVLTFRLKLNYGQIVIAKYAGDLDRWLHKLSIGWAMMYIAPDAWQPLPEPPSADQIAAYRKRITVDPTPENAA